MESMEIYRTFIKVSEKAHQVRIKHLQHISLLTGTLLGVLVSLSGNASTNGLIYYRCSSLLFALCTLFFLISLYWYVYTTNRLRRNTLEAAKKSLEDRSLFLEETYNITKFPLRAEIVGVICFVGALFCLIVYIFS